MASPNFGDTAFEGAIQPEVPIVEPVQDNSELFRAEGMGNAAKEIGAGVSQAINFFGSALDTQNKAKTSGVLSRYQEDIMLITDAVEQGLSVPAARMRIRAIHGQYLADNPSLQDDLNTLHGKLVQNNGLANITTTGNEDYQRNQKLIDEAHKGGWIVPGEDPAVGTANYINAKRESEALDALKRRVEWKAQNRLEITEEDKWQASNALRSFVASADPWVQAQIGSAKARVENGEDRGAVLQQLEETIGIELQKIGTLKALGAEGDMSYLLSGVEKQVEAYKKWSSGEYTTQAYEAQIKRIEAHNKLVIMSDPEMGVLISASNLIGNTDPILTQRIGQASLRMFGENSQALANPDGTLTYKKPADVVGREEEIKGYLGPLKNAIENSILNPSPEINKEVSTHITNLLRGVYKYGVSSDDARDFTTVIEFFASPDVGKFSQANNAVIPANVRAEAGRVIKDHYEKALLPIVREAYEQAVNTVSKIPNANPADVGLAMSLDPNSATAIGASEKEVSSVIEPFWNGVGVEFRVKAGMGLENNATVISTVNSLNSGSNSIANPLNTLIRASAHMQGHTDYKKMYEEDIMQRLWGTEDDTEGNANPNSVSMEQLNTPVNFDNPSDLDLADFNENTLEQFVSEHGASDPKAMITANDPLGVAQAYLGMNENNPEQAKTLAAFIKKTTGTSINPAQTAWCAAFIDAVLHASGSKGTGKLNARSYLTWGVEVDDPKPGDVVVLQRGGATSWQGHVGFFMGFNEDGTIRVLGGNQSDSVSEDNYDAKRVLGFRRAG